MAYKGKVRKKGTGDVTDRGKEWARQGGFGTEWAKGLTDSDIAGLEVVADHTDEVIEALGIAIGRALEAIGIEAESDAANLCPVDTGRLRNSITHTIDGGEQVAIVGTNTSYAIFVHENRKHPQRFLTDAVTQNADKYRKIFEAGMKNA